MYNFSEYRKKVDRLIDIVPWGLMVAPGLVQNKDGSVMRTFSFRGPDLNSATQEQLVTISVQLNNVLKRLGSNWALHSEAQRVKSKAYAISDFPDPVSLMIDEERKEFFSSGVQYENYYYFTLFYLPPPDRENKIEQTFMAQTPESTKDSYLNHLKEFEIETQRVFDQFAQYMVEAAWLTDDETLTYLHSCVSPKRHPVKMPEIPMYLDALLCDTPFLGGFTPQLGDYHLRVLTVMGFPGSTIPGMLDDLNRLNFEYRWTTRFIPLDKTEAIAELDKYRSKWYRERQGMKEAATNSSLMNNDALNKSEDADQAMQVVGDDLVSYGYFTAAVVVMDRDANRANKKARAVEKTINNLGFAVIYETMNVVDAWAGSLPGHVRANVRRPLINSMNLAHLFPLSAIWAGPEKDVHFDALTLMYTHTPDNIAFRYSVHVGDVGHTMIVGPTGAGKSVLLGTIVAQFRRYENAQIYIFDKGGSCRVLTAGVGGDYYDLAADEAGALAFQPLANIDSELERAWAADWVYDILEAENVKITPEIKKTVWNALTLLAVSERDARNITGLTGYLMDQALQDALLPYTNDGAYGHLFDATSDNLDYNRLQVFEMETLMNTPRIVQPALNYLFHKLEQRFTGAPSLLILDESWVFLDNPSFAAKIREWLKVLRKANVSVIFATQSLQDIAGSKIAPSLLELCFTKIYLPNSEALNPQTAATYRSFGLNEREIQIVATAIPKQHYYYKSLMGSQLFELALGPLTLAYVAAGSKEDQNQARQIIQDQGLDNFNEAWLQYKRLPNALDFYQDLVKQIGR